MKYPFIDKFIQMEKDQPIFISLPGKKLSDVDVFVQTIESNIKVDYQGTYDAEHLKNVVLLFRKVFSEKGEANQLNIYKKMKQQIGSEKEKNILNWLQNHRCRKYSNLALPLAKPSSGNQSIELCPTTDDLRMSRFIHMYTKFVKEGAQLTAVLIGKFQYFLREVRIKEIQNISKRYLFKHRSNQPEALKTPWMVETTKDGRHIWRGDIDLDRNDVASLLKFILTKRPGKDECPSILINAGSHGSSYGKNAHSTGNFQLTEVRIYDEIVDTICQLIQDSTLKINQNNVTDKIYVHKLSTSIPCTYPLFADHIIDVQCLGAFERVKAKYLVPRGADHNEVDLVFLDIQVKSPLPQKEILPLSSVNIMFQKQDILKTHEKFLTNNQNAVLKPQNKDETAKYIQEDSFFSTKVKLDQVGVELKKLLQQNKVPKKIEKESKNLGSLIKQFQSMEKTQNKQKNSESLIEQFQKMEKMENESDGSESLTQQIDPQYEPTQQQIREYATKVLGMKLPKDYRFLDLAREALKAPLPNIWKPYLKKDGSVYYKNKLTHEKTFEHPTDIQYRKRYLRQMKKVSQQKDFKEKSSGLKPTLGFTPSQKFPFEMHSLKLIGKNKSMLNNNQKQK